MKRTPLILVALLTALTLAACDRSTSEASATTQPDKSAGDGQHAMGPRHQGDDQHAMGHMDQRAMHQQHHGLGATGDSQSAAEPQSGTIDVTVGDHGFQPSRITLKKGEKSTLRFTRTSDKTCATEVAFPELGIAKKLPLNQPVDVDVPVDKARMLTFQCGMGMYKSQVVISG